MSSAIIYKEFEPHPILREFIKCFWILERTYDNAHPTEEVMPDSYVEVIFNFGKPYFLEKAGDRTELPFAFIIGLLKQSLPLHAHGKVQLIVARFYPWAVPAFFDRHVKQNINTDFSFHLSEDFRKAAGECFREGAHEKAAGLLEKLFLERFIHKYFDRSTVNAAAQIIYQKKGDCKIEDLAELLPTSLRTLQRNFHNQLGISPKSYVGNVRFDQIKKKIAKEPDLNLTELAYEFGYFDQAHFIKDFKNYCHMTPSEFAGKIKEIKNIFCDKQDVVFLQSTKSDD